ncbi:Flp pilus assembly complex ATPase component TadA [Dehalococcoidia bacterium]|nr:Flp pilus assembly complex ATPase component TadA [Dehalococcoidia bacterium]
MADKKTLTGVFAGGFMDRLGQALQEGGFITQEQLNKARELSQSSGKRLTDVLQEQGFTSREILTSALSFQFKIPVVHLKQAEIDPKALELIPEEFAREHEVFPFGFEPSGALKVATENPQNFELINTLSGMTRKPIRTYLPLDSRVGELIESSYSTLPGITEELTQAVETAAEQLPARTPAGPPTTVEELGQVPIVRAVEMITFRAVKSRASDIHIVPTFDSSKVLYRIDGVLHESITLPLSVHQNMISRIKVMANMDITEKRRPQDGHFTLEFGERKVDFRVAAIQTSYGEMMVIRVLDKSFAGFDFAELGLVSEARRVYDRLMDYPLGMILISGPTGSGKTTTLYATVNKLADGRRNVMTIEDPVEYRFDNISQIETNPAAGIDFATGLRAIMRMDPDIILVGEIRDGETARVAIQAANTGHLVLSSIHANDSASATVRLLDLGVESFAVSSGLIGVVAQRLVRKICPHCKTLTAPTATEAIIYEQEMQEPAGEFYSGRGCNFCSGTGFLGQLGVFEVLLVTEEIRSLILRSANATQIKEQAIKEGTIPLRRDGMLKAKEGMTTIQEVIRKVFTTD